MGRKDTDTEFFVQNTNHLQEVRQNLETNITEFEKKAEEELAKKLEIAEQNREKAMLSKLEQLKKHVSCKLSVLTV